MPFALLGRAGRRRADRSTPTPAAGNAGVVQVLDACGGMLSAVARTRAADARGWHPYGVSDPDGFAAMGTVETLLHLYDVAGPLGLTWDPDPDVVRRVLERLFPDEPADDEPWPTLLRRRPARDPAAPLDVRGSWDGTVRGLTGGSALSTRAARRARPRGRRSSGRSSAVSSCGRENRTACVGDPAQVPLQREQLDGVGRERLGTAAGLDVGEPRLVALGARRAPRRRSRSRGARPTVAQSTSRGPSGVPHQVGGVRLAVGDHPPVGAAR